MSLLRKIQDAACDPSVPISALLLQAKVLAARLGHKPLRDWVEFEINGYPDKDSLPPYRRLTGIHVYGNFAGAFNSQVKNHQIPLENIPEEHQEVFLSYPVSQSIASLAELLRADSDDNPRVSFPTSVANQFSGLRDDFVCMAAWRLIPRGAIAGIIDAVRSKVVDLALQIEQENPAAGDAVPGDTPVPQDKVSSIFVNIMGGNNNVAAGSGSPSQSMTIGLTAGDLEGLKGFLLGQGIQREDVAELEQAVKADPPPREAGRFGPRLSAWLGKMTAKAASGAWQVAAPAATTLLTKRLSEYFGLK